MSRRIEERFAALAKAKRKALITYVMAGDPNIQTSTEIVAGLPAAGADLIEIGMPFSDPMADGPTIQAAGLRALKARTRVRDIFKLMETVRKKDKETPLILMGYFNVVYRYGIERFCKEATRAGADGIILVDLPPEEEEEFIKIAVNYDFKLIRLIAPTTEDKRLAQLSVNAGGFLYYIAVAGITGTKSANTKMLKKRVIHIKSKSKLPVTVGFGIKTPEQVAEIAKFSDAVVVGSALVDIIATKTPATALKFVNSLRAAIDAVKVKN